MGKSPKWKKVARMFAVLAVIVVVTGAMGWYKLLREVPQSLQDETVEEYFKYGSIGTESRAGVPFWIWVVLPRLFPEYLPGQGGYASLGIAWEEGRDMPIGFSRKTIGFDRVGINCALCHTATVRESANAVPAIYVAGPSHTLDALAYQRFLFSCAADPRFTSKSLLAEIGKIYELSLLDRLLYRYFLIPGTRKALLKQKEQYAWTELRPNWGRGRVDPFNPVKTGILNVDVGATIGNADMVPIWNMRPREEMPYHWDGMNTDLGEVVLSSAIGDGATAKSLPLAELRRLQEWLLDLQPPTYPFSIDQDLAGAGADLYQQHCASCHAVGGARTGQVMPVTEVGTDPLRAEMWTPEAAEAYNNFAESYSWDFNGFRSTGGYLSVLLDAIWIRAPYLHNGSVPTLRDLLEHTDNRPTVFYRGYDVYEPNTVGFVSSGPDAERLGFRYDTEELGNSNQGHLYGTQLSRSEKEALIEYLKTL